MIAKGERYEQILVVLARHGIGVVDDHLIKHEAGDRARAEHLRRACEDLGAMFVKLGQVLSTRGDLLPNAYREELAKLQDDVPAAPTSVIADVIRQDLGAAPDRIFASFDERPLGSASIGQVHAARLPDGREVVVKVRRPGVDALVRVDLEILASLVKTWSPRFPFLEQSDAAGLVREFSDALLGELDFGREAASEELFRKLFRDQPGFNIPAVVEEVSKGRVLTEERMRGRKASEVTDLPNPRRAAISRRIVRFVLEPAFEHGVFHADPHAGNLLIGDDDTLSVIDFGKVGRLSPEQRRRVADIFIAIDRSDAQRIADRLIDIASPAQPVDRAMLTASVDRMLALYANVSLENVRVGDALGELLRLVRSHHMRLPGNLVQFFKALAMSEGLVQTIDPDLSFSDYLRPMVGKLVFQGLAGRDGVDHVKGSMLDAAELGVDLPKRVDRILGEIERGDLRIWARVDGLESLVKRLERVAARTNATILAAASIVGIAMVFPFYHPRGWERWLGVVFWIAAAAVIAGAVRALWRLSK